MTNVKVQFIKKLFISRLYRFNTVKSVSFATQETPSSKRNLFLKSIGVGAVLGTGIALYQNYQENRTKLHTVHDKVGPIIVKTPPTIQPTRQVFNQNDKSGLELYLFQYQTCPFCCKVRSFLDFAGLSYSVIEVDAVLRQSIRWSEYKKVPILLVRTPDGQFVQLNDSSMIISVISSFLIDKTQNFVELANFYPILSYFDDKGYKKSDIMNKYFLMFGEMSGKVSREALDEERKWRSWADEHLVHLISPNVYRNKTEALETFEWFADTGEWDDHFPRWERNLMVYGGALAMWGIGKILKKRHNLSDDVRSHLYSACDIWTKELEKKNTVFIGGKIPNLADLAVFGVLSSMEGCEAFSDCLKNTNIGPWFYAMKMNVEKNRGVILKNKNYS